MQINPNGGMALRCCVAFTFPLAYCGIILFPPVSDKDELVLEIDETKKLSLPLLPLLALAAWANDEFKSFPERTCKDVSSSSRASSLRAVAY